jgi:alkylation response protein AidB-like acyl-CoA dehydrogenase
MKATAAGASMDTVLSLLLSRSASGSDAAALKTKAVPTDAGYALTGTKGFISARGIFGRLYRHSAAATIGPDISAFVVMDGSDWAQLWQAGG